MVKYCVYNQRCATDTIQLPSRNQYLSRGSGFKVVAMYDALDINISIHDLELAYRMIFAMRKSVKLK